MEWGFLKGARPQLQYSNGNKSFQETMNSLDLGTEGLKALSRAKSERSMSPGQS